MIRFDRSFLLPAFMALAFAAPPAARAADAPADTLVVPQPEVVVSATRTKRKETDVPNGTAVVTHDAMVRHGVHTLAEALQDVTGIDTGEGSDNGSRVPNVGMWGLKEFDALLFTLDGVPVGGPFNPSLTQIPVEDLERVEIVKGPQGTMYGVSAFAGMIQAFTRGPQTGGEVTLGGGSFGEARGNASWGRALANDRDIRLFGSFTRADGWQDRTEGNTVRGGATTHFGMIGGRMTLALSGYHAEQDWGSPLPYEDGAPAPGFIIDRNYAVNGAEVGHTVFSAVTNFTKPVGTRHRFENTLSYTHDKQDFLRSFPGEISGDTLNSNGLELEPKETSVYEDARFIGRFEGKGQHELVAGAALTWGETKGEGREFDFDQLMSAYPDIPEASSITDGEDKEFEDKRLFGGFYLHDAWTPMERLTLEAGGRVDLVSEELETEADLPTGPVPVKDTRDDTGWSGDFSALYRLLPAAGSGMFETANLYGSIRRGFKPAAPNLAEAEAAEILEPENTKSWEVGFKGRTHSGVALDLSAFHMDFENMVVSVLGAGGLPELTNAGKQRFQGFEGTMRWTPAKMNGTTLEAGYAYHDAKYVDFTLINDAGEEENAGGHRKELVPLHQVNGRITLRSAQGLGGFVAARYMSERPFTDDNLTFDDAFTVWDAGVSMERGVWRATVTGWNLGDERHVTAESEIGAEQFYPSPGRRFIAQLTYRF